MMQTVLVRDVVQLQRALYALEAPSDNLLAGWVSVSYGAVINQSWSTPQAGCTTYRAAA